MSEPIVISFKGFTAKKNNWKPKKGGGIFHDKVSAAILKEMKLQLGGEFRDLYLENPDVEMYLTYTNAHVDRDNVFSTVIDILGEFKTIRNDNIAHFNGTVTFHPAVRGEEDEVTIVLHPQESIDVVKPAAPRYVDPKRARRLAKLHPAIPATDHIDELPDIPDNLFGW